MGRPTADQVVTARLGTLDAPGIILLDSRGERLATRTFAQALARRFADEVPVTVVHVQVACDPRAPCVLVASPDARTLEETRDFRLMEEAFEGKAEAGPRAWREAGVARKLRLAVDQEGMAEAARALLAELDPHGLTLVISHHLRPHLEPALYLRVAPSHLVPAGPAEGEEPWDAMVVWGGDEFVPGPASFVQHAGSWTWRRPVSGIVLAGGHSRRMGRDKAWLPVAGVPMIEGVARMLSSVCDEVLISAADPERYAGVGPEVVVDREPDQGPLMAVTSSVSASQHQVNLVVPVDAPDVPLGLLHLLLRHATGVDGVVPVTGDLRYEPLLAVYCKSFLTAAETGLAAGERTIFNIYPHCRIRLLFLPERYRFANLNLPEDYERHLEG